jgi:hypothetical protein
MNSTNFACLAALLVLACDLVPARLHAQTDEPATNQILAAVESGIDTEPQFRLVADFVKASDEDEKWRTIPWIPSLWEGLQVANEKQKPMFIWAMNGDPLGCV